MKKSKIATTIAEAMVVTLIIVSWLTWVYSIYTSSLKLTIQTENKIQAIQIAREWIEAVTNIRDTNWLLFSSNAKNCWKTLNYDNNCISSTSFTNNIANNWNYRVLRDTVTNRWILQFDSVSAWDDFLDPNYKNFYKIYLDTNWLYTHSSWTDTKILYTRQIKTSYIDPGDWNTNNWLLITSIVRWSDSSSNKLNEVKLESILTNHN